MHTARVLGLVGYGEQLHNAAAPLYVYCAGEKKKMLYELLMNVKCMILLSLLFVFICLPLCCFTPIFCHLLPSCCPSSCRIQTCPLCPTKTATGSRGERSAKVDKRTHAGADYPAVSSTVVTQQPVLTQIYRLLCATILIKQSDAIKVLSAMSVPKAAGNIPPLHLPHTFAGRF